jgi:hypothetical protein
MAILTADGVKFGFDDDLNSRRQIFAVNTAWIFYQNTTPTGWSKVTTQDNKALRVVSGSGGGDREELIHLPLLLVPKLLVEQLILV